MSAPRKPDAIIYPAGRLRPHESGTLVAAKLAFGPIFGTARVCVCPIDNGALNFAYGFVPEKPGSAAPVVQSRLYPTGHPAEKQTRYDWHVAEKDRQGVWLIDPLPLSADTDRPEAIKFGFLKPDPHADDPDVADRITAAADARVAALRDRIKDAVRTPEGRAAYRKATGLDDAGVDALLGADAPAKAPAPAVAPHATPAPTPAGEKA